MEKKGFMEIVKSGATRFGKQFLIAGGIVLGLLVAGKILSSDENEYAETEFYNDNTMDWNPDDDFKQEGVVEEVEGAE